MEKDAISIAPISTKKLASLLEKALNVGLVCARIAEIKAKKLPNREMKLKIERADKTIAIRLKIERYGVRQTLSPFRLNVVANM